MKLSEADFEDYEDAGLYGGGSAAPAGGANYFDFFGGLAREASGSFKATQRPQPAKPKKPVETDWKKFIPWAIGGVVALFALGLIAKMFK